MKLIVAVAVLTAGWYVLACWRKPFRRCGRCGGLGLRMGRTLIRKRPVSRGECGRCRATGLRLRHGRRAFNHFHRLHRDGTR